MKSASIILWFALLLVFISAPAKAQDNGVGFGVRGGFGLNPDQLVVGAQFTLGKKAGIARIVPSVDFGFFDNVTTITFNGDFLFQLKVEESSFGLYGGGGPTLTLYDFKSGSSWEFGITVVAGTSLPLNLAQGTNIELRLGIGDIPDFRLLVAVNL
ncbi:MAG: hypothetical protein ACE5GL_00330 [Calditrichia bacterium]